MAPGSHGSSEGGWSSRGQLVPGSRIDLCKKPKCRPRRRFSSLPIPGVFCYYEALAPTAPGEGSNQMQSGSTLWKSSVLAASGSYQERSCILSKKFLLTVFVVLLVVSASSLAQTLTPLKNQPPDGIIYTFQLTDGTVMAQGGNCSDFWQLTPDNSGSYVNGTWSQLASLPSGYAPYATASAVLADGRLLLEGGEYSKCGADFTLTNQGAIYDPVKNTWTTVNPPKGWTNIGDSPSTVLAEWRLFDWKQTDQASARTEPHDYDVEVR